MIITNSRMYDSLKNFALIWLPALITLYVGLGLLWDWGNTDKVAGSGTLISAFLGTILQISNKTFQKNEANNFDGYVAVTGHDVDTGIPDVQLVVTEHPDDIVKKDVARFKVGTPPGQHKAP